MKKSFLLYTSFYKPLSALTDEQLGRLARAMFRYHLGEEVAVEEDIAVAWGFLVNQFEVDGEKYEDICRKRSEAGKKGMMSRWGNITNNSNCYQVITNDNKEYQTVTKITDNENENDNENDNDNVNDSVIENDAVNGNTTGKNIPENGNISKKNIPKSRFVRPTPEEVAEYCAVKGFVMDPGAFHDYYESKGWKVGREPMRDWKAAARNWERGEKSRKTGGYGRDTTNDYRLGFGSGDGGAGGEEYTDSF